MKKLIYLLLLSVLWMQGCASYPGFVKTSDDKKDVTIAPEMQEFLKQHPNPVVVLRVPTLSTVTTGDGAYAKSDDYNEMYGLIEKNLIRAGFTVRDRGLLNNLLKDTEVNYEAIGKKIKTDLIIEITKLNFQNYHANPEDVYGGREITSFVANSNLHYRLTSTYGYVECKIIIVDKGQTGAFISETISPCANGNCCFETTGSSCNFPGESTEYDYLRWTNTRDAYINRFSQDLINVLKLN